MFGDISIKVSGSRHGFTPEITHPWPDLTVCIVLNTILMYLKVVL